MDSLSGAPDRHSYPSVGLGVPNMLLVLPLNRDGSWARAVCVGVRTPVAQGYTIRARSRIAAAASNARFVRVILRRAASRSEPAASCAHAPPAQPCIRAPIPHRTQETRRSLVRTSAMNAERLGSYSNRCTVAGMSHTWLWPGVSVRVRDQETALDSRKGRVIDSKPDQNPSRGMSWWYETGGGRWF